MTPQEGERCVVFLFTHFLTDLLSFSHFGHCGICAAPLLPMIYGALGRAVALNPKTSFYFAEILCLGNKNSFWNLYISLWRRAHTADHLRLCKWLVIAFINKKCVLFGTAEYWISWNSAPSWASAIDRQNMHVYLIYLPTR